MKTAFFINVFFVIFTLSQTSTNNFKQRILSPGIIFSLFVIFYCIIGVNLYWNDNYYHLGKNYEESLVKVYYVISIFTIALHTTQFIIFKVINPKNSKKILINTQFHIKDRLIKFYVIPLLTLGYLVYMAGLNVGISGLFGLLLNSLIPIVGILTILNYKKYLPYLIGFAFLSIFVGFRYRLILLFFPIIFYAIWKNNQNFKKILIYSFLLTVVMFIIAVVGVARKYGSGLQLDTLSGLDFSKILIIGLFNDTSTLLVTGSFIEYMDTINEFSHIYQIAYIAEYLIPSILLDSKDYSPVLEHVKYTVGDWYSGSAILGFGEYYHTGGMIAVIFFAITYSFWLTYLYKRSLKSDSTYNLFFYFTILTWFINSLTRGYLPQNFQDLLSMLIGFYFIRKQSSITTIKYKNIFNRSIKF